MFNTPTPPVSTMSDFSPQRLARMADQLIELRQRVEDCNRGLAKIADALHGPRPSAIATEEKLPQPLGALDGIELHLELLRTEIRSLESLTDQLFNGF